MSALSESLYLSSLLLAAGCSLPFTENIRRFYNNSMLDADKQAAINLFLGVDSVPSPQTHPRPHYQQWFDPQNLEPREIHELALVNNVYKEYYKPHILSQFQRLYAL